MLTLDHIVFAGKNITDASQKYGDKFAVKIVKGGEQETWGTYNYMAHFSNNCYIEWLGIRDVEKARHSKNPLIQHLVHIHDSENEQGPFQLALRTNQLSKYIEHFKDNNIPFVGPIYSSREKPDGTIISWQMVFPIYNPTEETLPFLIQWDQSEEQRIDRSTINDRTISAIHFKNTHMERFNDIYRLSIKKRKNHYASLRNTKLLFSDSTTLAMDIT